MAKHYFKDMDDLINNLRNKFISYKSSNPDNFNTDEWQKGLISEFEELLNPQKVEYFKILQTTKLHSRKNILQSYVYDRLESLNEHNDFFDNIDHYVSTKAQSKKNKRVQEKLVKEKEYFNPNKKICRNALREVVLFSEDQLESFFTHFFFDYVHRFQNHTEEDINLLSASNLLVLKKKDKEVGKLYLRIKKSLREAQKKTDLVLCLREPKAPYDSVGSMEVFSKVQKVYESSNKLPYIRQKDDEKLPYKQIFYEVPSVYDKNLINLSESIAKRKLNEMRQKKKRNEHIEISKDDKKMPGIFYKRHYKKMPMETQLYSSDWFNLIQKYHTEILVNSRVDQRKMDVDRHGGFHQVVKYLDDKFSDIFSSSLYKF